MLMKMVVTDTTTRLAESSEITEVKGLKNIF